MMTDYLATRGLDPARQVALMEPQAFAVLTDTTMRLGLYGGMFRFKPEEPGRRHWREQFPAGVVGPAADARARATHGMPNDDGSWSRHSAMVAPRATSTRSSKRSAPARSACRADRARIAQARDCRSVPTDPAVRRQCRGNPARLASQRRISARPRWPPRHSQRSRRHFPPSLRPLTRFRTRRRPGRRTAGCDLATGRRTRRKHRLVKKHPTLACQIHGNARASSAKPMPVRNRVSENWRSIHASTRASGAGRRGSDTTLVSRMITSCALVCSPEVGGVTGLRRPRRGGRVRPPASRPISARAEPMPSKGRTADSRMARISASVLRPSRAARCLRARRVSSGRFRTTTAAMVSSGLRGPALMISRCENDIKAVTRTFVSTPWLPAFAADSVR